MATHPISLDIEGWAYYKQDESNGQVPIQWESSPYSKSYTVVHMYFDVMKVEAAGTKFSPTCIHKWFKF